MYFYIFAIAFNIIVHFIDLVCLPEDLYRGNSAADTAGEEDYRGENREKVAEDVNEESEAYQQQASDEKAGSKISRSLRDHV